MGTDPLMSLHNHTLYSDGWFTPEEVVQRAWQGGLRHVAITDHLMTCKVPRPLTEGEFQRYHRNITALKEMYAGRMQVLVGVEIDSNPERCDLSSLPIDLINKLDLVLFEYAQDRQNGGASLRELAPVFEQIEVPIGLCHWDIDRIFKDARPEDVADLLASHGLFVEVSTSDYYRREGRPFFLLGERFFRHFDGKVRVSIGTDMHRRLDEVVNIRSGQEFIRRLGLQDMMVF